MRNKAKTKDAVLTENTAQSVFKYLSNIESNRVRMRTRWIWELLQNARDASSGDDTCLVASVEFREGELVFQHNGRGFTEKQVAHLIFHGSTKVEDEGTIGQFGSGFLTTHLLSSTIDVSGQLDDSQWFGFRLERETVSVEALRKSMDKAWDEFDPSLNPPTVKLPDGFTTQFTYSIGEDSADAVDCGIATLKQCAPFVVVFNQEFSSINIKKSGNNMVFKVTERTPLKKDGLQQVTVLESENGNRREIKYLLAQGDKASVAVPLEPTSNDSVCLPVGNTPRLFLGFPLVGTENFSFPTVVNSFNFTPTENRDDVYLGQGTNDANIENQAVFEEACELLVGLLRFAASSSWRNTYVLANVPDIREQNR